MITAFTHCTHQELLDKLKKDPEEVRRQLGEAVRKVTVLKVNEEKLVRRYTTLLEQEQHLRKENSKLRDESSQMQVSVTQRMGYLQRCKVQVRKHLYPKGKEINSYINNLLEMSECLSPACFPLAIFSTNNGTAFCFVFRTWLHIRWQRCRKSWMIACPHLTWKGRTSSTQS